MKKIFTLITVAVLALIGFVPEASAIGNREHRGIYTTQYLADWPTSAITERNAEQHKRILRNRLDGFQEQNVNVIYYHVRANCDAAYDSKYEPWSAGVGGKRGTAPAFDPFKFVLEECHARGIEVYAWFNPYRAYGIEEYRPTPEDAAGRDYEEYLYDHPDWLIIQPKEAILNPALEVVKQRICDVITDVIEKYDVDGIIFDDYFYSNPSPLELDVDLYNAAKAADPTVGSHIEWRCSNINDMMDRVYDTIKSLKPYLVFGVSPAGTASPPNIEEVYGLEPVDNAKGDYDWQYNAIASDPLNWYKEHNVDFMAPQIYWPDKFDYLQTWWAVAARKFERHLYSAVSLSKYGDWGAEEFNREVEFGRTQTPENEGGIGFFRYATYVGSAIRIDGVRYTFDEYLGMNAYSEPALMPLRPWHNVYDPKVVTNLKREGNVLTWDSIPNVRYVIYSFPEGATPAPSGENYVKVHYTCSYEIPEAEAGNTYGVTVYDRYHNEYSLITEGAALVEGKKPVLTYPANGEKASDLFSLAWENPGCDLMVEVATDANFENIVTKVATAKTELSSYNIPNLKEGTTYYWRVTSQGVNSLPVVSDVYSFTVGRIAMTGPKTSDEPTTPTLSWTPAYPGSNYVVEVARNSKFTVIDYVGETTESSIVVPEGKLVSGYKYYVRVTAYRNGRFSISDAISFSTANVVYDAPKFVNPQVDGATIHSNEGVSVENWAGLNSVTIEISETDAFPARKLYKLTLRDGATSTPALSEIKVASKVLVDGKTYYVRTRGNYFEQGSSKEAQTEYTISSFVYSSEAGVSDLVVDNATPSIKDNVLSMPVVGNDVEVYTTDGKCVFGVAKAGNSLDLNSLPNGLYIVRVAGPTPATIKWVK